MALLAKVEFSIHDVKKEEPSPKKKTGRYGNRPASAPRHGRPKRVDPPPTNNVPSPSLITSITPRKYQDSSLPAVDSLSMGFQALDGAATTGNIFDNSRGGGGYNDNNGPPGPPRDRRLSPEQRTKQQQLSTGNLHTTQRINPAKKIPVDEGAFKFSAKPPDREALRREQDTKIGAYRSRHPEIYEPPVEAPKEPELRRDTCHHDVTQRILPRDRTSARSNKVHLNDPLPYYPFLRENQNHGIHKERWSVMTIPADDPERCRPQTTGTATKSHGDFDKWYNSGKWRQETLNATGRGMHTMTIERADLL